MNYYTKQKPGDILRILREEIPLTQEQLAKRLGVHRSTISKWENGTNHISVEDAQRLAKHFHISVCSLLGNSDECREKYVQNIQKLVENYKKEMEQLRNQHKLEFDKLLQKIKAENDELFEKMLRKF